MSFDTNQKNGLLEAAAKLIIRDQLLNERINSKEFHIHQVEVATIAVFNILNTICQIALTKLSTDSLLSATRSLKDELITRYKHKIE